MRGRRDLLVAITALAVGASAAWWLEARSASAPRATLATAIAQVTGSSIDASRRNAIVTAAQLVGPAVVSVNVVATQVVRERSFFDDPFMDPFFRGLFPPRERLRQVQGLGSGFIVSEDGYILTNSHVVSGATEILVTLMDGRQLPADLVQADNVTDLAVPKIDATGLPTARLGDSDSLLIGEWAIAIGNPFGYLLADRNPSVTVGVLSAIGRDVRPDPGQGGPQVWSGMIQTDAAINPGNSGGPLVNSRGEVVGVNTAVILPAQGLCFAIPVNTARWVASRLIQHGRIRRGYLGLGGQTAQLQRRLVLHHHLAAGSGMLVLHVEPGSPAAAAELQEGDVIVAFGGETVAGVDDLHRMLTEGRIGVRTPLTIIRRAEKREVEVVPVESRTTGG